MVGWYGVWAPLFAAACRLYDHILSPLASTRVIELEKFHLGQHTIRTGHRPVTLNYFKILSPGFRLPRDKKITQALLIKVTNQTRYKGHQSH